MKWKMKNKMVWELEEINEPLVMLNCDLLLPPQPSPNLKIQIWAEPATTSQPQWFIFDAEQNFLLGGCIAQTSNLLSLTLDDGFYYFRPAHPEASRWSLCGVAVGAIREISFILNDGVCSIVNLLSDEYSETSTFSITFKGVAPIKPSLSKEASIASLKSLISLQYPEATIDLISFLPELLRLEFSVQIFLVVSCLDNVLVLSSSPIESAHLTIQRALHDQNGWGTELEFHISSILTTDSRRFLSTYYDGQSMLSFSL
jgi:hypothetical protein